MGGDTARTPEELRPKVLTAVIPANSVATPLGLLAAGHVLESWAVVPLFVAVAAGMSWMALVARPSCRATTASKAGPSPRCLSRLDATRARP
ncbi:MAG TPA: hypothetical protein VNJ46_05735 [Gaiellaceae bacterium]|nr:hypothetical protein [Gaiellaceae bacterium]